MSEILKRKLGSDGPMVSEMGLGCMGMSEFYGNAPEEESMRTLARAVELGVIFLDTADVYGNGENEKLIGKFLQGRKRESVFLCTKFANMRGADGKWLGISGKPEYVAKACEASLRRLGVEYVDLYYQHRVDPEVPIEETVGAMAKLVKEGKVKNLGMSEAAAGTLRRACKVHKIAALQTEYSLWTRDAEADVLPACRELGVAFVAYSPLGRGFLTGGIKSLEELAPDDWRRNNPRFQGENFEKNMGLVKRIGEMAKKKGCLASQLALAWVMAQGDDIIPIPGTKRVKYLEENVGAAKVKLSKEEVQALSAAVPVGAAVGTRYPEMGMKAVNR